MLSLQPIQAATAKHYYTDGDNYYLSDKAALTAASAWQGQGALKLGLSGAVDTETFGHLLQGTLPNGQCLGVWRDGKRCHRAGLDVTLSAPKSVSILALVGGDSRLLEAHHQAVKQVIDRLEVMAAEARVTQAGKLRFEKTGNLVIASFCHTTSRALDPQLHTHLPILNMTYCKDHTWRALASSSPHDRQTQGFRETLYRNQHYFGLVYTAALAKSVRAIGYRIRQTDRWGNFDIAGLPQAYLDHQAKRRAAIKASLAARGLSSAASAAVAALDTRDKKGQVDSETLKARWQADAKAFGVDFGALINAKSRPLQPVTPPPTTLLKAALGQAISHLSDKATPLTHANLVGQTYRFGAKDFDCRAIEQAIGAHPELVALSPTHYTTLKALRADSHLKDLIRQAAGKAWVGNSTCPALKPIFLSAEHAHHLSVTSQAAGERWVAHLLAEKAACVTWLRPSQPQSRRLRAPRYQTVRDFLAHPKQATHQRPLWVVDQAQQLSVSTLSALAHQATVAGAKWLLLDHRWTMRGLDLLPLLPNPGVVRHTAQDTFIPCDIHPATHGIWALSQAFVGFKEAGCEVLALALSEAQQASLIDYIRYGLKAAGRLGDDSQTVTVLSHRTLSKAQRQCVRFYQPGAQWVMAGKAYTVIAAQGNTVTLGDRLGGCHRVALSEGAGARIRLPQKLALAEGEVLRLGTQATVNRRRFAAGSLFTVSRLTDKGLILYQGRQRLACRYEALSRLVLDYAYVSRPQQLSGHYERLLVQASAQQLNDRLLGRLSHHGSQLHCYSHKPEALARRLRVTTGPEPVRRSLDGLGPLLREEVNRLAAGLDSGDDLATLALDYALVHTKERESAIPHTALMREALTFALGKLDLTDVLPVIDNKMAQGSLRFANTHWLTPDTLALEAAILATHQAQCNQVTPLLSEACAVAQLDNALTAGQKACVIAAVTTCDRFISVQGDAGVGKTTMMRALKTLLQPLNIRLVGLTPTHQACQALRAHLPETTTLDAFLTADHHYPKETFFILDEAGMVGNRRYHQLQQVVVAQSGRLLLCGDYRQLQSIAAGIPHQLTVKEACHRVVTMTERVRQNPHPALKAVAGLANRGHLTEAHQALAEIQTQDWVARDRPFDRHASVIEIAPAPTQTPHSPLFDVLVADYLSRTPESREKTVIIAHAHQDRDALHARLRPGLKALGALDAKDIPVTRLVPQHLTAAQKLVAASYTPGDTWRFTTTGRLAKAGETVTVVGIDETVVKVISVEGHALAFDTSARAAHTYQVYRPKPAQLSVGEPVVFRESQRHRGQIANDVFRVISLDDNRLVLSDGKTTHLLDPNDPASQHWDYAYTRTAYGAQGISAPFVIALELSTRASATNWRAMLIDATRPSHALTIYTDNHAALLQRTDGASNQWFSDKQAALTIATSSEKPKTPRPNPLGCLKQCVPVAGGLAQTYLQKTFGLNRPLPKALAFLPEGSPHGPALVALSFKPKGALTGAYLMPLDDKRDPFWVGNPKAGVVFNPDSYQKTIIVEGVVAALHALSQSPQAQVMVAHHPKALMGRRLNPSITLWLPETEKAQWQPFITSQSGQSIQWVGRDALTSPEKALPLEEKAKRAHLLER